ncbi:MAG: hypothetical protein R3B13_11495 [Polyangiaceae bacterium]
MPLDLRFVGLAALLSLGLAGCAARNTEPAAPSVPDSREVARQVARLRGLPDLRPAPIEFVDEKRFVQQLLGGREASASAGAASRQPFRQTSVRLRDVLGEQVVGYYDERAHRIFLRGGSRWDDETVDLVAHEMTHSLQAQHLFMRLPEGLSPDARLATASLIEGDAMLVMLAYASFRQRVPVKRSLARAALAVADIGLERFLRANGGNEVLLSAPPVLRERVTFPYLQGLLFVGDLWRTGGFGLVNRVYEKPPTTTEHVLHPERYLAGELAVKVEPPPPPPGAQDVIQGQLGELNTRLMLEESLPRAQATQAAAGWGGDAFTYFHVGSVSEVRWLTTWDDENEASEFQRALHAYAAARPQEFPEGNGLMIRRSGARVVFAAGPGARGLDTEKLFSLVGPVSPAQPPFGALSIPPLRRPPRTRPAFVTRDGVYVNEYLGLVSQAPPGFQIQMTSATSASFVLEGQVSAFAGIELSEQIAGRDTIDELHGTLRDVVADALDGRKLVYAGGREMHLPYLGHAVERTWTVKGTDAGLSVIVLPICNGNGSFVFWSIHLDVVSRAVLQQWLDGIRPSAWAAPPVCSVLDP